MASPPRVLVHESITGYPLVAKPLDGVGCEGIGLVAGPAELAGALAVLRRATCRKEILHLISKMEVT